MRRGAKGEDVRGLQEALAAFGYEVGQFDGVFGFLTEDAVMAFQRDHRLRVDGIAGHQVHLALGEALPKRRQIHVVARGERLFEIAKRYDVHPDALRWMNGLPRRRPLKTGRRLVIHSYYVLAGLGSSGVGLASQAKIMSARRHISGMVVPVAQASRRGDLDIQVHSDSIAFAKEIGRGLFLSIVDDPAQGGELAMALMRRKARRRFIAEIEELGEKTGVRGLVLDVGHVPWGRGARVVAGLKDIRRRLSRWRLVVGVPPPEKGWRGRWSDLDYGDIARFSDQVVLSCHRWEHLLTPNGDPPGREQIEGMIVRRLRQIPPWKLLLGVPMGACAFWDGGWEPLSYRQAVTMGYAHRSRPKRDPRGYLRLSWEDGDRMTQAVISGRGAVADFCSLAHRYRLGGIYLHPIGDEDGRLWDVIAGRIKAMPSSPGQ